MDILIFGVCDVSRILDDNSNSDLSGKKAVLVLPADDEKAAWRTIQKARGAGWGISPRMAHKKTVNFGLIDKILEKH